MCSWEPLIPHHDLSMGPLVSLYPMLSQYPVLGLTDICEPTWVSQLSSKQTKRKMVQPWGLPHPVLPVPSLGGPTWLVEVWSQLPGQSAGNAGLLVGSHGGLFRCLSFGLGVACPTETTW